MNAMNSFRRALATILVATGLAGTPGAPPPAPAGGLLSPGDLKKLSIDELFDVSVTLVSKRPEKLSESPSAIQVITAEEIRRSGARHLADALRLVSNVAVHQ